MAYKGLKIPRSLPLCGFNSHPRYQLNQWFMMDYILMSLFFFLSVGCSLPTLSPLLCCLFMQFTILPQFHFCFSVNFNNLFYLTSRVISAEVRPSRSGGARWLVAEAASRPAHPTLAYLSRITLSRVPWLHLDRGQKRILSLTPPP